jgi:hypothetical protein
MLRSIEPHEDHWVVYEDGVEVLAGDVRQIEDWLDMSDNLKQPLSITLPGDACFNFSSEAARPVFPAHHESLSSTPA